MSKSFDKLSEVRRTIERVESCYDAEHDVPPGPMVTWTDEQITEAVNQLMQVVSMQQARIERLERECLL